MGRNYCKRWIAIPKLYRGTESVISFAIRGGDGCVTEVIYIAQTSDTEYQAIGGDTW